MEDSMRMTKEKWKGWGLIFDHPKKRNLGSDPSLDFNPIKPPSPVKNAGLFYSECHHNVVMAS
jgi:hypothetical protein